MSKTCPICKHPEPYHSERCPSHPETASIHPTAVVGGPPQWRNKEINFPVDIHPTATVGPLTQIDAGSERATIVGRNTQVMGMVHIGHGVQIGRGCDIASGTVIAGEVTIGNFVRIGVGAVISPYVTISDAARIGAGAVVVNDVRSGFVVVGNPARELRQLNEEELAWVLEGFTACE